MIRNAHKEYWNGVCGKVITDEGMSYNFHKLQQIMHRLLKFPYWGGTVLELGSGPGLIGMNLKNICNTRYIGVEISDAYVKHCTEVYKLDVRHGSIVELPVLDDSVDYVLAFDVLEHIDPEDRMVAWNEISRVLKDDGTMLINNPSEDNGSGHNPAFEFGFDLRDLQMLLEITNLKLTQIERFRINIKHEDLTGWWDYEWMVLQRLSESKSGKTLREMDAQVGGPSAPSIESSGN